MPKMVVYELFEVTAKSPDEAIEKAKSPSNKRSKSMYVAAPYLNELAHPVHLQEAQDRFPINSPVGSTPVPGLEEEGELVTNDTKYSEDDE